MDRDLILESFQDISQIQDYGECIQILESVDWNLDSALNSIDQSSNFATPETGSQSGNQYGSPIFIHVLTKYIKKFNLKVKVKSNFIKFYKIDQYFFKPNIIIFELDYFASSETKELQFNVDVRGQMISVMINEDKRVRDLAELVAVKCKEPHSKFKISGFKMPFDSNTQLKNLNLGQVNNVVANPIEYSSTSSIINNSENKKFHLEIDVSYNGEHQQKLNLTFEGKDTIGKVKTYVGTLLGNSNQNWTGWPDHIWGDDIALRNCGISEHASFTVDAINEQKITKPRYRGEGNKIPIEVSLNNSRIDEPDNEDEDDYYDYQDIDLEQETELTMKRSVALMTSEAHDDPMVATLHFSQEFACRYCPNDTSKPPFYIGSIEEAQSSTLNLLPKLRKPLFIYIHHGESIQANIFCTQVLCYQEIVLFFTQSDYMIWPWDVTYSENRAQLITWLTRCFGSQITLPIKILQKDQFPILMALGKSQGNTELLEILDGGKSKDEILNNLWQIKSRFHDKQQVDILAWEEQELRKVVKMEQDIAYQESLCRDQIKEKELDDKKRKIEEDEKNKFLEKQKTEKERNNKIQEASVKVPSEPEDGPDVITIRLRLPPNVDAPSLKALTRRFLYSHTLTHLIAYIESMGFLRNEFNLLMTYPRTNLTQIEDHNITLKSLGIPKRETLIIERV